jgi:choline transporter-like protein 2/4/5
MNNMSSWADSLNVTLDTATSTTSEYLSTTEPNKVMQIMMAYHFFGFLWTNQLIAAISTTTIAGAVCRYYWSREHSVAEMGRFPIATSFKNCFRYHLGSLAFGSFIIALVQFIRACLMYIDRQTKELQETNVAVKIALKVVACCLWCLEKCLKFISKNAYILIAMKGRSFCTSTRESFILIFANMAQVTITSVVTNLIGLVAQIAITVGCALLLFVYFDQSEQYQVGHAKELNSLFPPVILGSILAWFVSGAFIGVYEMCVDTILLCFCEDRRINKDSGKYYMSAELAAFVETTTKKKKDKTSSNNINNATNLTMADSPKSTANQVKPVVVSPKNVKPQI